MRRLIAWRLAVEMAAATGCVNPRSKNQVVQSPSLLENVDVDKPVPRRYCLGMDTFVDESAYEKENRRPLSLSLGRKKKAKASDFPPSKRPRSIDSEFGDDDTYREMSVQYVPKSTRKNNDWSYNNFIS